MNIPSHIPRKAKHKVISPAAKARVIEIYKTSHLGEGMTKFRKALVKDHGIEHSLSWITNTLVAAGVYEKKYYPL